MKYRFLVIISLLMLLTIIGIIFIKSGNSLFFIKDEFIAFLEESYQVKLQVQKASFWPLNQITLEEVEITSLDNKVLLSVPAINIKYNIFEVFEGTVDIEKVINYVKMDNPRLMVLGPEEQGNIETDFKGLKEGNIEDLIEPFLATPFQLIINNGTFQYRDYQNDFSLENLSLTYQKINRAESRVMINTSLEITGLKWNDIFVQGLQLDNLEINLVNPGDYWQANLTTDYFNLDELLTLTSYFNNLPVQIMEPGGMGKVNLELSGRGLAVTNYSGSLYIENGSGIISSDRYSETGRIDQLKGEVLFNSGDNILFLKDCNFLFQETPYRFDGSVRLGKGTSPQVVGHLISEQFEPTRFLQQFAEETGSLNEFSSLVKINGKGFLDLTIAGTLSDPGLSLEFYLTDGMLDEQKLDNLQVILRYHHGYVYLDTLNLLLDEESLISAQGLYNTGTAEYSIDLNSENLNPSLLQKYIGNIDKNGFLNQIDGKINLVSSITGDGFKLANLNIYGQLEVLSTVISGFDIGRVESEFWLADSKLLLQKGEIDTGREQLSLSGEVGLSDSTLHLELMGSDLELSHLRNRLNLGADNDLLNSLSGIMSVKGTITQSIQDPLLNLTVEMVRGEILGQQIDNLQFEANYSGKKIAISNLKLRQNENNLTGEGIIDITGEEPYINAKITGDTVYKHLTELIGQPLPLEGELSTELNIEGPVKSLAIRGNMTSRNSLLEVKQSTFPLDDLQFSFIYDDNGFSIEGLKAVMNNSRLQVTGKMVNQLLDLQFVLNEFNLQNLPLEEEVSGKLGLTGSIRGSINEPEVEGFFTSKEIAYQDIALDSIRGQFQYLKGDLLFNNIQCNRNGFSYLVNGQIYDLVGEKRFSLALTTDRGKLYHFYNPREIALPIPEDYLFKGILELEGSIAEPLAQVDLIFESPDGTETMELKGKVGRELALAMKGQGVEVGKLPFIQKQNVAISGKLDFSGELRGSLDSYDLVLNTNLSETSINNYTFKGAQGVIKVANSKIIDIQQQLSFAENRRLEINGSIPLEENGTGFNLKVDMNGFPLKLASSYYPSFPGMDGFLIGELVLTGSISDPSLTGDIYLVDGSMDLKLPDTFTNLRGQLVLSGKKITFPDLKGQYGDGDIILQGTIYPFAEENYAIRVSGSNLPFDYGSFKGRFDPEIKIMGSFEKPFVQARAITHDFTIGLPIKWPVEEGREPIDFDIVLEPGEDVYVKNNNIEVLIQEGSLRIVNQDNQVEFEGILESEQGSFDYYNNKFIVSEAKATFRKYNGFIPDLSVRASTRVRGTIIEVNLTGQANNLLTTFSSHPPLDEKEILTLLTSKGGLGEFMSGNYENIVTKEIMRLFYNYLQIDVVEDIQSTFKEVFRLDRFELDTYNLGWDKEIVIYLGKYINDKIYLQYSSTITPDQENSELALRYYITDYLHFESSWQGKDNYSWSLKTNLDF